jgi:mRNA interferase RelE/StbE
MTWRLVITPGAERDFANLNPSDQQRIRDEFYALANEPQPRRHLKKLKGNRDNPLYSLPGGAVPRDSHHRGRCIGHLRD